MSDPVGKIASMESSSLITGLVVGLILGLALGAIAVGLVLRARGATDTALAETAAERGRAETSQARTETAQARSEAANARAEMAQQRVSTHQHRAEESNAAAQMAELRNRMAEASTEAAKAREAAATVSAQVARAEAQRDAALSRALELAADRESLVNQFKVLSTESLERQDKSSQATAEARLKATQDVVAPVAQALQLFHERINEVEKDRVQMATDLRNQVLAVKSTGDELRRETAGLATALRKPQVRGAWGETQLKRVAEITGMVERCDFDLQYTTVSDDKTIRPDMRVNLSDGKFIFVDSKVPLSAFLDAAETSDEAQSRKHMTQFAKTVKTHIDQLSGKQYWRASQSSPEFVVLFMPSEAFLAGALEEVPNLHEYAAERDIVLATPAILIAVLRAVSYGWRQAALAESAAEVFMLGRDLYDRLGTVGGALDKLGRQLGSSVKAYNSAVGSIESRVMVSARRFRDLKVSDLAIEELTTCEESVRPITAPELVEDATQVAPLVGRESKRALAGGPEADELVRQDPELEELFSVEEQSIVKGEAKRRGRSAG